MERNGRQQPLPSGPMEPDRKTLIADAAIALLGSAGARGLTHRAVDAQAGLPAGSTSFYCRSRLDLLRLTLRPAGVAITSTTRSLTSQMDYSYETF